MNPFQSIMDLLGGRNQLGPGSENPDDQMMAEAQSLTNQMGRERGVMEAPETVGMPAWGAGLLPFMKEDHGSLPLSEPERVEVKASSYVPFSTPPTPAPEMPMLSQGMPSAEHAQSLLSGVGKAHEAGSLGNAS